MRFIGVLIISILHPIIDDCRKQQVKVFKSVLIFYTRGLCKGLKRFSDFSPFSQKDSPMESDSYIETYT